MAKVIAYEIKECIWKEKEGRRLIQLAAVLTRTGDKKANETLTIAKRAT